MLRIDFSKTKEEKLSRVEQVLLEIIHENNY